MHKLLKRIVTIMLVLCLLVTSLPMAVLAEDGAVSSGSNEDGATSGEQIVYSVNSYSGAYDGEAHSISLNVTTPDVQVYYAAGSSEYSTTLPTFTDPGTYTVSFMLVKDNYETVASSATVTISKAEIQYTISGFSGTDEYSVEYDGQPHAISLSVATPDVDISYATSAGGPYSTDMPSFTEANNYVVYYKLEKTNYETVEGSVNVEITPADVSNQVVSKKAEFLT